MRRAAFRRRAATGEPAAAKKLRKPAKAFDVAAALAFVDQRLTEPPPPEKKLKADRVRPAVVRVEGVGELVGRWVVALQDAPTANRLMEMQPWALDKLKKRALGRMLLQSGGRRPATPLQGRPLVRMVRFTSAPQDYDTSWTKIPLDRLQVGRRQRPAAIPIEVWQRLQDNAGPVGLGYIRGDSRHEIDLAAWSEPVPPGKGCVLVEVWTGRAG